MRDTVVVVVVFVCGEFRFSSSLLENSVISSLSTTTEDTKSEDDDGTKECRRRKPWWTMGGGASAKVWAVAANGWDPASSVGWIDRGGFFGVLVCIVLVVAIVVES